MLIFLVDQATKFMVATKLMLGEEVPVLENFFYITSHRNAGAAFGILQHQRWLFIVTTIIAVSFIVWYLNQSKHHSNKLLPLGLSFVLGGALGNLLDRVLRGQVIDFLQFNFGTYVFPVFNIADCAICVGAVLVILNTMFDRNRETTAS